MSLFSREDGSMTEGDILDVFPGAGSLPTGRKLWGPTFILLGILAIAVPFTRR